jgi:hypothetical protein
VKVGSPESTESSIVRQEIGSPLAEVLIAAIDEAPMTVKISWDIDNHAFTIRDAEDCHRSGTSWREISGGHRSHLRRIDSITIYTAS